MSNADLANLNPHSFERLVRALAFHIFGTGGAVYSSGADGGRDFTIEGAIKSYEAQNWRGYLVLQCKFRETKVGDRDPEWLCQQIEEEKQAFLASRSGRKAPDYYVVATNVTLSGADGVTKQGARKGGLAKVSEALAAWQAEVGIKGYDIWPKDKIIDLIATAPEIRRTFAAWVTSGDVLSEVLDGWQGRRPDFEPTIRRSLLNSVRRNQFTSLKDAGSVSDLKIRTSQVFIDTPYRREESSGGGPGRYHGPEESRVIRDLVSRSKERLDPESLQERRAHQAGKIPYRNRVVILGGPGQGKSTVASFLAQIFRSVLVSSDPSAQFDDALDSLVPEILSRANVEGISTHVPRRYPVLIQLPRFADAITTARDAKESIPSLLSFVAESLSDVGDAGIGRDDLRGWLRRYPWLVVLDGLDEVPPSGERSAVLDAVSALMTEIADTGGDVLTVVTTRPQGYNRDLDPGFWEHWELTELTTERALAYAAALGDARYPDDRPRREEIQSKLTTAAAEPATARLMVSPLQVTILYLIVDTGGSAPTARWTLFNEYYEVLRRREKAKGGALQAVLERNWAFIGPIHQRAGLILQALSEVGGSAQASFNRTSFEELVRAYLSCQGFVGDDLESRASELAGLALNRLVLLSAREEGSIRFDVRSLQEFMAAAALTSGETAEIEARLLHLSGISHWRHTFLIAASRCFAEDAFHHRRTAIVALTRALDTSPPDSAVANGARLALEMFIDGIGVDFPVMRRVLAQHAVDTLSMGSGALQVKVGRLWEPCVADIFLDGLRGYLHSSNFNQRRAAWQLLLHVASNDPSLAVIAKAEWPREIQEASVAYFERLEPPPAGAFRNWVLATLHSFSPASVLLMTQRLDIRIHDPGSGTWRSLIFPTSTGSLDFGPSIEIVGAPGVTIGITSVSDPEYSKMLHAAADKFAAPGAFKSVCEFGMDPSRESLAIALRAVAEEDLEEAKGVYYFAPWPLFTIIDACNKRDDLRLFADQAERGDFGDREAWDSAEARWAAYGIIPMDLLASSDNVPFERNVAVCGAPSLRLLTIHHDETAGNSLRFFLGIISDMRSRHRKFEIAEIMSYLMYGVFGSPLDQEIDKARLTDVFAFFPPEEIELSLIDLVWPAGGPDEDLALALSRLSQQAILNSGETISLAAQDILQAARKYPSARGLIYLALLAHSADEEKRSVALGAVDSELLAPRVDDSPQTQVSCLCFTAGLTGAAVAAEDLAIALRSVAEHCTPTVFSEVSEALVEGGLLEDGLLVECLMDLLPRLGDEFGEQMQVVRAQLKSVLDRRKSGLLIAGVWLESLSLPADAFGAIPRG